MNFLEKLMESEVGAGNKHYKRDFVISLSAVLFMLSIIALTFILYVL